MILTADWHLTARPEDEYRWGVFPALKQAIKEHRQKFVVIAGDIGDRKDKHPAALVNRMIEEFTELSRYAEWSAIMGNHDKALRGEPFWNLLNLIEGGEFLSDPAVDDERGILFLPFAENPAEYWEDVDLECADMIVMHQPLDGAIARGHAIEGSPLPKLPRGVKAYAGDIHDPQYVKQAGVTYIGAPHPVNFGDTHQCRFLIVDDKTKEIVKEIELSPPRKHVFVVKSIADLAKAQALEGDKARVRISMKDSDLEKWPKTKRLIEDWAKEKGIDLVSIEPTIEMPERDADASGDLARAPADTLADYIEAEGIPEAYVKAGNALLEMTMKERLG